MNDMNKNGGEGSFQNNDNVVFDEILSDLKDAADEFSNDVKSNPSYQNVRTAAYEYVNTQQNEARVNYGNMNNASGNPYISQGMPQQNNPAPSYTYQDIPESNTAEAKKKPKIKAEFSDVLLLIFTVFTVFSTLNACFSISSGIAQSLIQTAFLAFVTLLVVRKTKRFPKKAILPAALCLVSAFSCSFTPDLPFGKTVFSYYIFSLYCLALTDTRAYPISSVLSFFHQLRAMLLIPVRKLFVPLASVFRNRKIVPIGKIIGISSGVILGIPVFIITAVLLSSGDILFNNVLTDALSILFGKIKEFFSLASISTILLTVVISPVLYSFLFSSKYGLIKETLGDNKTEAVAGKLGFIPSSMLFGFYGIISVCYVTYILSQFGYLFSGFTGSLPMEDYSLSLYARRGFFEMSSVAIINLVLICLGSMFTKRNKKQSLPKIYKLFATFFCSFTVLLIITAIAKMALYITELGFTEKRLTVLVADIILLVTFIAIFFRLIFRKFPCLRIISTFAFIVLTIYFAIGSNVIITYFNTNMYLAGKHETLHLDTILETKDDYFRIVNIDKVRNDKNGEITAEAKKQLFRLYEEHKSDTYTADSFTDFLADLYLRKHGKRIAEYEAYTDNNYYDAVIHGYPQLTADYTASPFRLYVKEPDRIVSLTASNELISASYSRPDSEPFRLNEVLYFIDWVCSDSTDLIAVIEVTDTDGNEYTFDIRKQPENEENDGDESGEDLTDDTVSENTIYVATDREFMGNLSITENAISISQ